MSRVPTLARSSTPLIARHSDRTPALIDSTLARATRLCAAVVLWLLAQAAAAAGGVVTELRVYPAGQIVGVGWQDDLSAFGPNYRWAATALYNRARRGSTDQHSNEEGDGIGAGLLIEGYFANRARGWFLTGRTDVFSLGIDYRDPGASGRSRITVIQPTIGGGYAHTFGEHWRLQYSITFGAEINVKTRGAKVADGLIGLAGVSLTWP